MLTAASGIGVLSIYSLELWWPSPEVLRYTSLAALGVLAGLYPRIILVKHTPVLRFLAALFSAVAGLWGMNWISQGYVGIQVIDLDHAYPDYASLIELGLPWLVAILTILAWKKRKLAAPAKLPQPEPEPASAPLPASTDVQPVPLHLVKISTRQIDIKRFLSALVDQVKSWPGKVQINLVNTTLAREIATEPRAFSQMTSKPLVVLPSSSPKLGPARSLMPSLAKPETEDEHLCPYCLENVDLDDPRGVKVCHICGSYHHADCWDVTGSCRAPHPRRK